MLFELVGKGWYFSNRQPNVLCGPYASEQIAKEKFEEWSAYVLDAPTCHHPSVGDPEANEGADCKPAES